MIRKFYRLMQLIKNRIILLFIFLVKYKSYINCKSYYPEKKLKTKPQILIDFILYIIKNGEIDKSYFELGLDVKGNSYNSFLSYNQYMLRRDKLNLTQPYNYVCLMRNKSLFTTLCNSWGFPTVKDLAKIKDGIYYDTEYSSVYQMLETNNNLFVKPIDSKKGQDIHKIDYINNQIYIDNEIRSYEDLESFMNEISYQNEFLIQKRIIQHPQISSIYEKSINTLRVVTINNLKSYNPDDIYVLGVELRVGANGNFTDNISVGGLKIGVNDSGYLCKYGYFNHKYGTKTPKHPDTNIIFEGYTIPYYNEAVDLCKQFHSKIKDIHLIGWDVAITEDGPIFIEGNDSCGTDFQVLYGPMKNIYDKFLPK